MVLWLKSDQWPLLTTKYSLVINHGNWRSCIYMYDYIYIFNIHMMVSMEKSSNYIGGFSSKPVIIEVMVRFSDSHQGCITILSGQYWVFFYHKKNRKIYWKTWPIPLTLRLNHLFLSWFTMMIYRYKSCYSDWLVGESNCKNIMTLHIPMYSHTCCLRSYITTIYHHLNSTWNPPPAIANRQESSNSKQLELSCDI